MDSIEEIGFKFPFIAKPVSVDGNAKSNEMSLVFNENGLKKLKLKKPFMMQEFVNHGRVIFKVYVEGDHVKCVKRKSLPDISEGTLNNMASDEGLLLFKQILNLIAKNDSSKVEGYISGVEKRCLDGVLNRSPCFDFRGTTLQCFIYIFFKDFFSLNSEIYFF